MPEIADLDRTNPVLKEFYIPGIYNQLPEDYAFFSEVKSAPPDMIQGKYGVIAVETGRNHGGGPRGENQNLPNPGSVEFNNMRVNVAYEHQLTAITQQAIDASASDRGGFARQMNKQIEGVGDAMSRRMSRWMCAGDSSACLANAGATTASVTVQLADGPLGFATQHLEEGMVIDILTRSSGATIVNGSGRTIESIDHDAKTITLDTAGGVVTTTTSEGVYLERSRNYAPMGLPGIAYSGNPADINNSGVSNLQNTNATTETWFRGIRFTNPGGAGTLRALSLGDLNKAWLTIYTRSGARKASDYTIWSRPEAWDEYGKLISTDKYYAATQAKTDAGHAFLEFNGIKWKYDRDFPPHKIFFHNKASTPLLQMGGGMRWVEAGGKLWHWVMNSLSYKACLYWFVTLATEHRNRNAVIEDIQHDEITGA